MITGFDATTSQGKVLSCSFQNSDNGYPVRDVSGLDPVKATIVSSSFANMDGKQYQTSRREERNMIIKLGLVPDYNTGSVSKLRMNLYSYFMPKSTVNFTFYREEGEPVDIVGIIESCEVPIFAEEPEATISILCMDPDFQSRQGIFYNGMTVSDDTEFVIEYPGTVDTGFIFQLVTDRDLAGFSIYQRSSSDITNVLDFTEPLITGDVMAISTISGNKYATRGRITEVISLLYGVSPYSAWINLQPGTNYLRVTADGAPVPFNILYTPKYGGL